jgi:hypothetical protein
MEDSDYLRCNKKTKNIIKLNNRIIEELDIFRINNIQLLPLNLTTGENTKDHYKAKLLAFGFGVNAWTKQQIPYQKSIESVINNNNVGFVVKTGIESGIVIIDWDDKPTTYPESKELLDLCLNRDTLTVKTPGNGYHFYFKYNNKLPGNRRHIFDNIDIRSNEGCCYFGERNDGIYTFIDKNKKIKSVTDNIIELIYSYKKINIKSFKRIIKENKVKVINPIDTLIDNPIVNEVFNLTEKDFKWLLFKLDDSYLYQYNLWMVVTILSKKYGFYDIWDQWSKTANGNVYNKINNDIIWRYITFNNVVIDLNYLVNLINKTLITKKLSLLEVIHIDYKGLSDFNKDRFTTVINQKYLSPIYYENIKSNQVILIMSSLGTGKTFNMIDYAIKNKQQILSIVHLKSLCENQVSSYNKHKLDIDPNNNSIEILAYNQKGKVVYENTSLCTTLDSLITTLTRIQNINQYVIYIDEIHRIIEYLITSDTLDNKRRETYKMFVQILLLCKGIVGTDGDINDLVFDFFDKLNIQTLCIYNTFKSYDNIPVKFYNTTEKVYDIMTHMVKDKKYFTVCCNTKKRVNSIKKLLLDLNIPYKKLRVYTRDEGDIVADVNIDWHKKYVIYSPSIVEGIDRTSIYPEVVFCFVDSEYTLSPDQSKQQICRNRNIKSVYVCFSQLTNKLSFKTYEDCYSYYTFNKNQFNINKTEAIHKYMDISTDVMGISTYNPSYYTELFIKNMYNRNLLMANFKYTLKNMLQNIGFVVDDSIANDLEENIVDVVQIPIDTIEPIDPSVPIVKPKKDKPIKKEDKNINEYSILLSYLKGETILPTYQKLIDNIETRLDYINIDKSIILKGFLEQDAIQLQLDKEKNKDIKDIKDKKKNKDVITVKESLINDVTINIKTEINHMKTSLTNDYKKQSILIINAAKEQSKLIKENVKIQVADINTKANLEAKNIKELYGKDAVKIFKADTLVNIQTLQKTAKDNVKLIKDNANKQSKILLNNLIKETKILTDKANKEIIKETKAITTQLVAKNKHLSQADKIKNYLIKKTINPLTTEEIDAKLRKTFFKVLKNCLLTPYYFNIFRNIREAFILNDKVLTNRLVNETVKDRTIKCIRRNTSNVTIFRKIMSTYLPEINFNDYSFDEYSDTFLKDSIDMTDSDFNSIIMPLKTIKKKPQTKLQLLKIVNMLLFHIVGDCYTNKQNTIRDGEQIIVFNIGGIDTYYFNSYINLCRSSINKTNIRYIHPFFIQKYNITPHIVRYVTLEPEHTLEDEFDLLNFDDSTCHFPEQDDIDDSDVQWVDDD